jgi:translation initiation factor IF-3
LVKTSNKGFTPWPRPSKWPRVWVWTWFLLLKRRRPPFAGSPIIARKEKEIKAHAAKNLVKEIRFGPNTDDHDFQFKLKHARNFLEEGSKVRAYVHFRGRAIVFKERGELLLLTFAQQLEDLGKVESMPKLEGKRMFISLAPKGVKK